MVTILLKAFLNFGSSEIKNVAHYTLKPQ